MQKIVFRHLRQRLSISGLRSFNSNQLSILRRSITYLGCVLTQFSGKDTSTNDCRFAVDFLYKSKPEYTVNQAYS